jgi:hypothetical protein
LRNPFFSARREKHRIAAYVSIWEDLSAGATPPNTAIGEKTGKWIAPSLYNIKIAIV